MIFLIVLYFQKKTDDEEEDEAKGEAAPTPATTSPRSPRAEAASEAETEPARDEDEDEGDRSATTTFVDVKAAAESDLAAEAANTPLPPLEASQTSSKLLGSLYSRLDKSLPPQSPQILDIDALREAAAADGSRTEDGTRYVIRTRSTTIGFNNWDIQRGSGHSPLYVSHAEFAGNREHIGE